MVKKHKLTFSAKAKPVSRRVSCPSISCHEAGHIVTAAVFGIAVEYARASRLEGYTHTLVNEWLQDDIDAISEDEQYARLLVQTMSGLAAELSFGLKRPDSLVCARGDFEQAEKAIGHLLADSMKMPKRSAQLAAIETASELLKHLEKSVNGVSKMLEAFGTLDGKSIATMLAVASEVQQARAFWVSTEMGSRLVARIRAMDISTGTKT